jgi:sulfur-carrier protein
MPKLIFTSHLGGIAPEGERTYPGATIGRVLAGAFAEHPGLRHYVLDDQGRLRKHVVIFADGRPAALTDETAEHSEIYVLQALSGG